MHLFSYGFGMNGVKSSNYKPWIKTERNKLCIIFLLFLVRGNYFILSSMTWRLGHEGRLEYEGKGFMCLSPSPYEWCINILVKWILRQTDSIAMLWVVDLTFFMIIEDLTLLVKNVSSQKFVIIFLKIISSNVDIY